MPYFPPDYIDNTTDDRKLVTVLTNLITTWEQHELDIASGFFEPKVWELLSDPLSLLTAFRLLLGRPPELVNPDADDGAIDLRQFYRERLRQDLERLPLQRGYAQMVDELTTFLAQETVQVRHYTGGAFLHGKAYLMPNVGIVGSSNFTPSGMTRKAELNLVQQNNAVISDLRDNWFEMMWGASDDQKADLIAALQESKFGSAPWTPHDVFIKVLYEYFKDRILDEGLEARLGVELASFQQEGLREAIRLIDRHGGVIVSDAVGLGKTYIGMSLLEHYVLGKRKKGHIPKGLVICPAQLRDLVWEPKLDEYGIKAEVVSQEVISREVFDWKRYNQYDVILIDESHNFRNTATNRYQNLMKMMSTGKRDTIVILLTATPINNSIWDLYNQVSIITRDQDTFFREYGIRNLRGFFREVEEGGADIFALLEQVMVRRSRVDVKKRLEAGEEIRLPGKGLIHFPERTLHSIRYNLRHTYEGLYDKIVALIENLALISYNIEQYRKADEIEDEDEKKEVDRVRQRSNALIGILKTLYLKRLESSLTAFAVSIRRQQAFQERFYNLLIHEERLLDSKTYRKMIVMESDVEDGGRDDDIERLIAALPEADIRDYDLRAIRRELERDMKALDKILDLIEITEQLQDETQRDAKLHEVKQVLGGELANQKVLIFSYYRDTAQYLYDALTSDTGWQGGWHRPPVIAVIHGETSANRENLVKRFAPKANVVDGEMSPITEQSPEIDILISTDVLSEGQNLQDAGIIMNYDLHWTPIRMIQRAGRIDRLGTDFEQLHIYNCFPEMGLESLLGLVERLQDRIRDIDRTVGLDASVLGEVVSTRSLDQLRRLQGNDQSLMDELEQEIELVSTDEMKFPLMLYLQQQGLSKVRSIPIGIGSGLGANPHRPAGIFFAFQSGDRHFWRVYTHDEIIHDKRRIFRYIAVDPTELRQLPADFDIFDALDRATQDVLKEINKAIRGNRVPRKLGKINRELLIPLQQASLLPVETGTTTESTLADEEIRQQVQRVVQNISLDAGFKRDKRLKQIRQDYQSHQNQRLLVEQLHLFFIDNELYRDVPVEQSTLEQVHEESLQLVAWEVFG